MGEVNRRRTERISLAIPIRVQGAAGPGHALNEATRTLEINRHGARIILKSQVNPGSVVQIVNTMSNTAAPFRLLRMAKSNSDVSEGGEWAVECLEHQRNIWGVEFPS